MFSLSNLDLSNSTQEIIILFVIFFIFFVTAWVLGKGKMIALILSFYPALFFYSQFPFSDKLTILKEISWQLFLNQLAIFLIFFVPTFLIINIITGRTLTYTDRGRKFGLAILGLATSILALASLHQIIIFEKIETFFPLTGEIWNSENLLFWLLVIPIILILLFIRR